MFRPYRSLIGVVAMLTLAGGACSGSSEDAPDAGAAPDEAAGTDLGGDDGGEDAAQVDADEADEDAGQPDVDPADEDASDDAAPDAVDDVAASCPEGLALCGDACVDARFDPDNCGGCGTVCDEGLVCAAGECAASCGPVTSLCGGRCVDTAVDGANCGECGTVCDAGLVCAGGTCAVACGPGTTLCGERCVDTAVDRSNCGACGTTCDDGLVCADGGCAASCGPGTTLCGDRCVDTDVDRANCGACGSNCDDGELCDDGACFCADRCDDLCTDLATDVAHCGACDVECLPGQLCLGGRCDCPPGYTLCGGVCRDTLNDPLSCGRCGTTCRDDQYCDGGACVAPVTCVNTDVEVTRCPLLPLAPETCGVPGEVLDTTTGGGSLTGEAPADQVLFDVPSGLTGHTVLRIAGLFEAVGTCCGGTNFSVRVDSVNGLSLLATNSVAPSALGSETLVERDMWPGVPDCATPAEVQLTANRILRYAMTLQTLTVTGRFSDAGSGFDDAAPITLADGCAEVCHRTVSVTDCDSAAFYWFEVPPRRSVVVATGLRDPDGGNALAGLALSDAERRSLCTANTSVTTGYGLATRRVTNHTDEPQRVYIRDSGTVGAAMRQIVVTLEDADWPAE